MNVQKDIFTILMTKSKLHSRKSGDKQNFIGGNRAYTVKTYYFLSNTMSKVLQKMLYNMHAIVLTITP